ncbi:hypothetical protein [Rheinheimera maricola]|uniref:Integrase catalytic domain-containing protein n=1 Tax=Rheinheimera maricola TaxID=2793282 RepID=A0ABS7X9G9_9GAMM|nr:hypothetical protein [Rheinheimera maricola]MBZ9612172.1 hypothetical protein [Rheinheimera maricola]
MLELNAEAANTELLVRYAQRLEQAKHGEKGAILAEVESFLGWKTDKFYRELKKIGWSSGNKRRCDAGSTSLADEVIEKVAALSAIGNRANGKQIAKIPTIRSVLSQSGVNFNVSNSQLRAVLKDRGATAKQLAAPTAPVGLASLYPNHVHQTDPSLCLLYYPPGGKGQMQRYRNDDDFYKNKPQNFEKHPNLRVWRYVLTDHASGAIRFRYFEAAGESTKTLYEFLLWAWGLHNDPNCPMRGLPEYLMMDKGSANTSTPIKRALRQLGVEVLDHAAKNARAKGQVENANNLVELLFESRLLLEPVTSTEELNQRAEAFQNAYNANQLPEYDAKHRRHKMARYECWLKIKQHQNKLRELPPIEVCQWLLTAKPETRKVTGMKITAVHPRTKQRHSYDLTGLVGIYDGLEVLITPMVLSDSAEMLVYCTFKGEQQVHQVQPLNQNEYGFFETDAVIAQEYKQKPDTHVDAVRKQALRTAYPNMTDEEIKKAKQKKAVPMNGELDALSHLMHLYTPSYMPVAGEQVKTDFTVSATTKTLSGIALKAAVLAQLNRVLTPEESAWLNQAGIINETDLTATLERMSRELIVRPALRAV